jgi:hypothetical protein
MYVKPWFYGNAHFKCCAMILLLLVSGCGQSAKPVPITPSQSPTEEVGRLQAEVNRLRAENTEQNQKRNNAERRVEAISVIVRLLVYALVATAIFLALSHHDKMSALKKKLLARPWGKWVFLGGAGIYLLYDVISNASLISDWLLSRV